MTELIGDIYALIGDYRNDEGDTSVQMRPERIKKWIDQFEESDREFILTELKVIFSQRYLSKAAVKKCLGEGLIYIQSNFGYKTVEELIKETSFLNLQRANKSQPTMLKILNEVLNEKFDLDIASAGSVTVKNYLYLDDVLCTGNTFYQEIKRWVELPINDSTNLKLLQTKKIRLWVLYLIIHRNNYLKKLYQFRMNIDNDFEDCFTLMRFTEVENFPGGKLDLVFPIEDADSNLISSYKEQVVTNVNKYCNEHSIRNAPEEFYRSANQPSQESFFSNAENRKRFEWIILKKGIEILNRASVNIPNLRALGYSLPSHKNFGFGTLSMTWRNIPNNCPLIFWYSGGGFFPLFVKHST